MYGHMNTFGRPLLTCSQWSAKTVCAYAHIRVRVCVCEREREFIVSKCIKIEVSGKILDNNSVPIGINSYKNKFSNN